MTPADAQPEAKPEAPHVFDRPHFTPRQVCVFTCTVIGICCSSILSVGSAYMGIKKDTWEIRGDVADVRDDVADHKRRLEAIEQKNEKRDQDRGDQLNRIERMLARRLDDDGDRHAGFKPIPKRAE